MWLQGYQPGQIVVLTPYLGQLLEIQRALKNADVQVCYFSLRSFLRLVLLWP